MIGDEIQNAIPGARGTPEASIAAIIGMTPHEQKGDIAPARDAAKMVTPGLPEKTLAISPSTPVAFAYPAKKIASMKNGEIPSIDWNVKRKLW